MVQVSEYRRFIAYFYEYIDGRKQKNAGFAKVELRNGMWRILFRLNLEPEQQPVRVYGFVREQGWLLGLYMGNLRPGMIRMEEWAYHAGTPVWQERYGFASLAGIWIQGADGRRYVTVWDEEPISVERFVLELPKRAEAGEQKQCPDKRMEDTEEKPVEKCREEAEGRETQETKARVQAAEFSEPRAEHSKPCEENAGEHAAAKSQTQVLDMLFANRPELEPFADTEFKRCVQLRPCDLIRMQQAGCKVGRNTFLQHGFYQYHHLLLAKDPAGRCVLGVPGVVSQGERSWAEQFAFDRFKPANGLSQGRPFGYWCKEISG